MKNLNFKISFILVFIVLSFSGCTFGYYINGVCKVHIVNENSEPLKKEEGDRFDVYAIHNFAISYVLKAKDKDTLMYEIFVDEEGNMAHMERINAGIENQDEEYKKVLKRAIKSHGIQIIDKKGEYKTKIYDLENARYKRVGRRSDYNFECIVRLEKK